MQHTILKRTLATLLFLFVVVFSASAQGSKPHFVINNPDKPSETQVYYDMLKDFNFEQYRFLDKRRTITVVNSNMTVELYSANELKEIYGKPVSQLTIMDNTAKENIAFEIVGNKMRLIKK